MGELLGDESGVRHHYTLPKASIMPSVFISGRYAGQYGISGILRVKFVITKTGRVERAKIQSTDLTDRDGNKVEHFMETESALLNWVKQMRFIPATQDGTPVATYYSLSVKFRGHDLSE